MTHAAAPIEHLARRRLWLGLELRSPIAERVERNPASPAILTLIELARDPLTLNSLIPAKNYLFFEVFSLLICVGNCPKNDCSAAVSCCKIGLGSPEIAKFPVKFPVSRELAWRRVRSALRCQPASADVPGISLGASRKARYWRVFATSAACLQTPNLEKFGANLPKFSGYCREYSRFREIDARDRVSIATAWQGRQSANKRRRTL
jgi:hypothetical protein